MYFRARTFRKYNLALQDNVLLPEGFTEYIHHVENEKEWRSLVNHGLIPGGVSLRTFRQAVFFTVVNPTDNQDGFRETLWLWGNPLRLVTSKNRAHAKNTWKRFQNTVF